jgi:hypothetical protein
MKIVTKRNPGWTYWDRTIGEMFLNGSIERYCYTLEDRDLCLEIGGVKIPKETAIPRGTYKLIIDDSVRYKRKMPQILDVPQFEGIRIHAGNYPVDTEGCILIGEEYDAMHRIILKSKVTFDKFFGMLETVLSTGEEISITIE